MSKLQSVWKRIHEAQSCTTKPPMIKEPLSIMTAVGQQLDEMGKVLKKKRPERKELRTDEMYRLYLMGMVKGYLDDLTNHWDEDKAEVLLDVLSHVLGTCRKATVLPSFEVDVETNKALHNRLCVIVLAWMQGL